MKLSMKSSIKFKLFLAICGLIVLYVGLSWFLNTQFLVKYYYLNKEKTLRESYEKINKDYRGLPFELVLDLERLERTEGLHITILNPLLEIKYNSSLKEEGLFGRTPRQPPITQGLLIPESAIIDIARGLYEDQPVIKKLTDRRLNSEFINLVGVLNNGDFIFINTPVVAIEESAGIANTFFLGTGLFTILTGLFLVFFFADRFTRPILQLNEIAQQMAKLDFSKRYRGKTHDEIGELGASINSLSEQLEASISELRGANEILREDIEKERKIDEMRKEFISNVSHELKTPLALIQGYAEGLKLNVSESEEDKDFYCEVIIDESSKMNKLVKQLLELSQIDNGYAKLDKTEFDLTQLVGYVLRKNALLLKENNIELITEFESSYMVTADSERIEQILVNYLMNAINHVDEQRIIKVKVWQEVEKAKVSVFNSGRPIPEEDLAKIWTSFYKSDKARKRSEGGTGLGLAIVRAIQDLHQNGCGVANKEQGVEFWFEVDLC